MRISWIGVKALGVTAFVATALAAGPALANGPAAPKVDRYPALSPQNEVVPVVAPGEEIGIACDALQYTASNNDVRVVLTISATPPTDRKLGYKKVLATNEELTKGAVRVRIPEVPELENHTVNVNVYVVNDTGSKNCDAGHMRIADGLKHPKRKDS